MDRHFPCHTISATNPSKDKDRIELPSGPSTSTVLKGAILVIAFRLDAGGSRSLKSTSGGRDKAAPPIRDDRFTVVANDRSDGETFEKAGSKKSGRADSLRLPKVVLRAVQSMFFTFSLRPSQEQPLSLFYRSSMYKIIWEPTPRLGPNRA